MKVKIVSERENSLLKRREVHFRVEHDEIGGTPPRSEVRRSVANALKARKDLVFVKKIETRTGTQTSLGLASVYETVEQARLVEPKHIVNRNVPQEKPEEKTVEEPKTEEEGKE